MKDNKKLVLVYQGMPRVDRDDRFSVVITPQNYLLRKEQLAIKQEYQSKKIAASLFDDLIESDKKDYSFFVYKEDEEWIFIAYRQEEITELLSEVGISPSNVDEIFFAQQLVSSIKKPISLGSDKALVSIGGVATIISKGMLLANTEYVNISDKIQPKRAVVLSKGDVFDSQTTLLLSIIFILFGLLFVIEDRNIVSSMPKSQDKISTILQNNPSLSSSYTRASILTKYKKIDAIERAKRDLITKLSKIIDSDIKVDEFYLNKNRYNALLYVKNINQIAALIRRAKKNGFKIDKVSSNQLKIEGIL